MFEESVEMKSLRDLMENFFKRQDHVDIFQPDKINSKLDARQTAASIKITYCGS